jgi:hypothetical protein
MEQTILTVHSRLKSLVLSPSQKLPVQVPSRSPLIVDEHPMDPSYSALMKVSFSPYFKVPQLQPSTLEPSVEASQSLKICEQSQSQSMDGSLLPLNKVDDKGPDSFIF